jgi:hypothetical protein
MSEQKANIFFRSPNYAPQRCASYKLVISLSARQFIYALTDESNEVFLLKVLYNPDFINDSLLLERTIAAEDLLRQSYKATTFVTHTEKWLLVPSEFLEENAEAQYLEKIYGIPIDNYWIGKDFSRSNELYNIFAIDKDLHRRIAFYYPKCEILHFITPLLKAHFMLHHRLSVFNSGIIEIFEEKFVYTLFRDKKLIFCNVFPICGPSDVLYYTLSVNQTLNLANERLTLLVTGFAEHKKELQQLLSSFFPQMLNPIDYFFKQTSFNRANLYHHYFSYLLLN